MQGCHSGLMNNSPAALSEGLNKLVSEHIPLRKGLDTLFSLCNKIEEVQDVVTFGELVVEVKEFFKSLEHHSHREEDHLFRMMEVYLGKNGGPIAVMEYEHEQANGYISEFFKNAKNAELSAEDMIKNAALIQDAYHTLLSHFSKEEQVLYPMAERMFTPEEKDVLNKKVSEQD